jgi:hypothetical protein
MLLKLEYRRARPATCQACGAPIGQPAKGRSRRTCSAACKQALYRKRRHKAIRDR